MPYGFNEDKSKADLPVIVGNIGGGVDISGYVQQNRHAVNVSNLYTFPSDGYIVLKNDASSGNFIGCVMSADVSASDIFPTGITIIVGAGNVSQAVSVHAGMKYGQLSNSNATAAFYPVS